MTVRHTMPSKAGSAVILKRVQSGLGQADRKEKRIIQEKCEDSRAIGLVAAVLSLGAVVLGRSAATDFSITVGEGLGYSCFGPVEKLPVQAFTRVHQPAAREATLWRSYSLYGGACVARFRLKRWPGRRF